MPGSCRASASTRAGLAGAGHAAGAMAGSGVRDLTGRVPCRARSEFRLLDVWQAVDHRTTRVVRQWFASDGLEPGLIESLAEQDLRTTVAEDVRLVESVQRGLESGGYRPAPLIIDPAGGVNSEHSIRALYEWLGEAMA